MWHEDTPIGGGCSISPQGIISLRLHDRVRVDIALDRAVRLLNFRSGIVMALSTSGSSAALLHPNGRVYQYGSRVEILAHDNTGNNKLVLVIEPLVKISVTFWKPITVSLYYNI